MKTKQAIKQYAKKGDQASARLLARELVRSRKAVSRLHTSKAQLNSVSMQLGNQLGAAHAGPAQFVGHSRAHSGPRTVRPPPRSRAQP